MIIEKGRTEFKCNKCGSLKVNRIYERKGIIRDVWKYWIIPLQKTLDTGIKDKCKHEWVVDSSEVF